MFNFKQLTMSSQTNTCVNINLNVALFHPFTVTVNTCGRSCNIINDPYAQLCVPNKIKNMNVKVFNLMSVVNESRFLVQNESCQCKCEINESVCSSKQKWNHNEYRCECNELDDSGSCKNDYIWNHRMLDCKCNKHVKLKNIWTLKIVPVKNVLLVNQYQNVKMKY